MPATGGWPSGLFGRRDAMLHFYDSDQAFLTTSGGWFYSQKAPSGPLGNRAIRIDSYRWAVVRVHRGMGDLTLGRRMAAVRRVGCTVLCLVDT